MAEYRIVPIEWEVRYPVHVEPIGLIRARDGAYEAKLDLEHLGAFRSGDAAVEAVWERFLEHSRTRHEEASHTHGAYERHTSS